jgi:hypothetical protein
LTSEAFSTKLDEGEKKEERAARKDLLWWIRGYRPDSTCVIV